MAISLSGYSQLSYKGELSDKSFKIKVEPEKVSKINTGGYRVLMEVMLADGVGTGIISLTSNQHAKMVESLSYVRDKYTEWDSVAKANNVEEISKSFEKDFEIDAFFDYGGKRYMANTSYMKSIFSDKGDGDFYIICFSPELSSYHNKYITQEGLLLVFSSKKSISDFLDIISVDSIKSAILPNVNDLFKN